MSTIWRYSGLLAGLIFPLMCQAQEPVPPPVEVEQVSQLAIWQNPLFIAIGVLLLLFLVSTILLFLYRARYIRFLTRCDELEPALKKTKEKLEDVTQELRTTSRKFSEETYVQEQMLKGSGAAIFKLNKEGECVYINARMEQLLGLSMEEVSMNGLINSVHPDDQAQVQEEWQTFAEREEPYRSMYRLLRQDGREIYILCRGSTMRDGLYNVIGYFAVFLDITEQVQQCMHHKTMEQRGRYFIQEIAGGFYELRPEQPIPVDLPAKDLAERIHQTMSVFSCNSVLAEMCGQSADELSGARLNSLAGGCGIFENVDRVKDFVADGFKTIGKEIIRKDRRGNPVYLRNDAVGIIENGFLVSIWGAQHDVSRQKREMEELNGRVEFFQSILNALPADVFVKDTRCRFLYVSQAVSDRTGIPADDWIEKTVFELMPGTPRSVNKNSIEVMKTGEMYRSVESCRTTDGESWMETFETPLASSDGLIEGVVGLSIDVTERTLRELALQKAENQFRSLAENGPIGIMTADVESRKLTYVNPVFCDFLGYTEEELLSMQIGDFHSPGSRRQVLDEWEERARNGSRFENALPCLRKDRSVVFADVGVSVQRIDGRELFVGVYHDASGRKKIEDDLISQRDYQAGLLRNSAAFLAVIDPDGRIRSINRAAQQALGFEEGELTGKSFADTLMVEADRGALADAISRCSTEAETDCEYPLFTKTGDKLRVACRIRPFLNKEGLPEAFSVVGIDVTQRRQQEDQLQSYCDQLREQMERRTTELREVDRKYQQAEMAREQTTEELKRLEGTLTTRTQMFEKDISDREKLEIRLQQTVEELKNHRDELEKSVALQQTELSREVDKRQQLEVLLQESRTAFSRDQEAFSDLVERRTEALEQDLEQRRQRQEKLEADNEELSRRRTELEQALAARTKELDDQVAARKAEESELRKMSRDLKDLDGPDKEALTKHIAQFKAEVGRSKAAENVLRQQADALQQKINEFESLAEQQAQDVAKEADERKRTEESLRQFYASVEADHRLVAELNEDVFSSLMPMLDLSGSILKDSSLPDDQRRQFVEIQRNSRRLLEIMKYRLELTHLDAGVIRPNPEFFQLQPLIAELETEFSDKSKKKKLFFAVSQVGDLSGEVFADRAKIRRLLCSLLDHAMSVTDSGRMGLHAVCEAFEDGRKNVVFQLMYSGLDQEKTVLAELLSDSGTKKPCCEMTDVEFGLDIDRRYAKILGGTLYLENRSGGKQLISLAIPFDRNPAHEVKTRNPFDVRVTQITRPQPAFAIEVKGDLLNKKSEIIYQIQVQDCTGGEHFPISFKSEESESKVDIVETLDINSPPVSMAPRTTLSDWTVIAKLPAERLQFARQGERSLNFNVRVRDTDAVGEQKVQAVQQERGFVEIRERLPDIYTAIWYLIQGLRSKFPENEKRITGGAADFLIKEAGGWSAEEKTAVYDSFREIVEVPASSVSWEEACSSHASLLRELANTDLRNDVIRLFFMLLIDENGLNADAQTSIPVFYDLCVGIGADMSVFTRLVDRFLMEHDMHEVSPDCLLGLHDGMNAREAKNRVMEEYKKWNSRVTHSEANIRTRARRMLDMISQVRAELKTGKKYVKG